MKQTINFHYAISKLTSKSFLSLFLPSLIIITCLWLPFGFTSNGLLEEWGLLGLFTTYGPIFFEHTSGPLAYHALRPLMVFPSALAYQFDTNSFYYWHVFTILSLMIKGAAASYLIFSATKSRFWSALMGILVLLFPADTLQLALRPLQINLAVALLLLSSSIFIIAIQSKRTFLSYFLACIAPLLLLSAILMYEATCTLILMPFMVLFIKDGLWKTLQQCKARIGITLLWVSALATYIVYYLIISPKIQSYQSQIISRETILQTLLTSLPKLFSIGILRSLVGGWFDALRMTIYEIGYIGYIYLAAIALTMSWLLLSLIKTNEQVKTSPILLSPIIIFRLAFVGLLLLICGYGPFLLVPSHLYLSQRTFLFATPGAAMVWLAIPALIFYCRKWLGMLAIFILIYIGLGAQLFQAHYYATLSDTQAYLLKNLIENINPADLKNKTLVIFDESNQLDRTWMFIKENLAATLTYFYQQPIHPIEICYLPTKEWRSADNINRMGTCTENKDNWIFRSATTIAVTGPGYSSPKAEPDIMLAKTQAVAITIHSDGTVSPDALFSERKIQLMQSDTPTAKRYRQILASKSSPFNFKALWATHKIDEYKWRFGNWWSLDIPIKGSGWREAEWDVNYFYHRASSWKTREIATLLFDLKPTQTPYYLRGAFNSIISEAIRDSIQIRINQKPVALRWKNHDEFEADIPANTLLTGTNTFEIYSKIDPTYFGLSLKFDQFEVTPIRK